MNYGLHDFQVDLMTNEAYSRFNKMTMENKDSYKMVFSNKPK